MGNSQKRVEGSPNLTCLNPVPPVSFLSGCAVTQARSLEVIPESPSGPSTTRAQQTPLLCCVPAAWPWFRPLFSPVRVALTCRLPSTHILPAPQRALKCPSRDVRPLLPLKTSGASQAPQGTTPAAWRHAGLHFLALPPLQPPVPHACLQLPPGLPRCCTSLQHVRRLSLFFVLSDFLCLPHRLLLVVWPLFLKSPGMLSRQSFS